MIATYRELLRAPHVGRLLGGTLLGRLPNGMGALAVVLLVRADGGGYALAGALSALYGLATAFGQPVLGRWMDRTGQTRVLLGSALTSAAGYAGLAAAGVSPLPLAVLAVLVAGFATPPLEPGLRALWPLVLRPGQVPAAYALDAAVQELLFTVGPLVVVALAGLGSAELAVVVTGLVGLAGTLVVATSGPSRAWRGEARAPDLAGPLRVAGLRVLLGALLFAGFALGVLGVACVAWADARGASALSGVFMASMSFGALAGGLAHGARAWARPAHRRLPWLFGALTAGYLPLVWAPGPGVMVPLAVLSGVFLAPVIACSFTIVDALAPRGTVTEAFAWLVTAVGAGAALGSAAAGLAGDLGGVRWAFAAAAAGSAAGLVVLMCGRGRVGGPPDGQAGGSGFSRACPEPDLTERHDTVAATPLRNSPGK